MSKVSRTFRIDYGLSRALTELCQRHGDVTWHVEKALAAYTPIKKKLKVVAPVKAKVDSKSQEKQGCWSPERGDSCDCPACGGFND